LKLARIQLSTFNIFHRVVYRGEALYNDELATDVPTPGQKNL